ncbi:Gag pol polyprotein [Elysia marginata]|uniref:Gag pol polyprotein n=1 Tax=Elysia marginata TaxID=1093978 RepID=A0AAV4H7Z0_9GAST|nr:Gag pol polyprotein [Elysia marginata]
MDGVLRDVPFAFVYLDVILVAIHSPQEHSRHLQQLFTLLSDNGLVINKAKCIFGADELDFLGHHVSADEITPLAEQVVALRDSRAPQNRSSLKRFLGMINYYHRFLPGIAPILEPLHAQASGKGQNIEWTKEYQQAFDSAKDVLSKAVLLITLNQMPPLASPSMHRTLRCGPSLSNAKVDLGYLLHSSPENCQTLRRNIVLLIVNCWHPKLPTD